MDRESLDKIIKGDAEREVAPVIASNTLLRIEKLLIEVRDMMKEFMQREY